MPKVLTAVASLYMACQDWAAAMAVAHDIAHTPLATAADVLCLVMDGVHSSGSSMAVESSGMPVLICGQYHAQLVKVGAQPMVVQACG